ncbi:MAG: putative oxidoreductase [Limisphaerales bacterium]|jgi:predicted oxidoreductase
MIKLFSEQHLIVGTMRLGVWGAALNQRALTSFVESCLSLKLSIFDHADIYGDYTTEAEFGAVLADQPSLRAKLKLITKCGIKTTSKYLIKSFDTSEAHIISSVEQSLKNLKTDYIDLLLLHRPDYLLDVHQVASAFEKLQESGKVNAFGVSNFSVSQFEMLNQIWPLATNQIEASVMQRAAFDNGTLDQCYANGLRPQAWSPLAGGAVFSSKDDILSSKLNQIASELECELDTLLYAWLLRHPSGIMPVTGTSKISRLENAIKAVDLELSATQWYTILEAASGSEVA